MLDNGYDKNLASPAPSAPSGTLGILIPPSIMLVVMADRMSMSVGDLFLGALFPGILLGGLYIVYLAGGGFVQTRARVPAIADGADDPACGMGPDPWPWCRPRSLILAVLGSIFFGFATPTEAAGVGAAGALCCWLP